MVGVSISHTRHGLLKASFLLHRTFIPKSILSWFILLTLSISIPNIRDASAVDTPQGEAALQEGESFEELLQEAQWLFLRNQPIDARAKLQKALALRPKDFRVHMHLGRYYLGDVGHYRLAHQYLRRAYQFFEEQYGTEVENSMNKEVWQQNAMLLYLLAESKLNLDDYQGSLDLLNRYEKTYWDKWFPGTKSWVLWKLGRTDEAIQVAQFGLLRGAEPGKTFNILGILFSAKGNRRKSLEAFGHAMKAELTMGSRGQVATPLNNSGEVYRELFDDDMAEASWLKATSLPDGCQHILPSLNLAILYIDSLRLFQAERALEDFVDCFKKDSLRIDSEHKGLLALARGRIAMRMGDIDKALEQLRIASESTQWFGKIGTNENDLRFAANLTLSQALSAKAETLRDIQTDSLSETLENTATALWMRLRAWWLAKRAREIALDELSDFEDLFIRHTDAMLEYPTLGYVMEGFPSISLRQRIKRMLEEDPRDQAHNYYRMFLGENYLARGDEERASELFNMVKFRKIDRLARVQLTTKKLLASRENRGFWPAEAELVKDRRQREEIFQLLPSHLRYYGLKLPIALRAEGEAAQQVAETLLSTRFEETPAPAAFQLHVMEGEDDIKIALIDSKSSRFLVELTGDKTDTDELINDFINKAFSHRLDPPGEPVPPIPLLEEI